MALVHWPSLTFAPLGQTEKSIIGQRVFLDMDRKVKFSIAPVRGTPVRPAKPNVDLNGTRVPYEDFNMPDVSALIISVGVHMTKVGAAAKGGRP